VVLLTLGLTALTTAGPAADWPHWRGPNRDGTTTEPSGWVVGGAWPADKPDWTAAVGRGASSTVVAGGRVYTLGWEGGKDVVRCLDAGTGKELWAVRYPAPQYGRHHEGDEGLYSGPSSTPEYDPDTGLLFTLGADGQLAAWDARADGKRVWGCNLYDDYGVGKRPRLTRAPRRDYGYTSGPLARGGLVIVEVGSPARGTLIAFDQKTGKEVWASALKDEAGHTGGPAPITVEGVPCLAVVTLRNLAVVRLDAGHAGETVATFPWVTDFANTIASPAVHGDCVLVTAAYNHNAMVKVRVSLKGATEVWRAKAPSKVCSPVVAGGHVYCAWQAVRCLDWETGKVRWEGGSFGDPGSCAATSDGRLIVYGKNGKLALVEGAARSPDRYTELAVRDGLSGSLAWPHVVVAGGRAYCRDRDGHLACLRLGR
jgi:outer membrane protein assembly factor BamB